MKFDINLLLWNTEREMVDELEQILEILPVKLFVAYNQTDVIDIASQREYALVIVNNNFDQNLIFQTVTKIKSRKPNNLLPFIVLTDDEINEAFLLKHIAAGAIDFLKKPVSPHLLLGKVNVFIELYRQRKKLENEIEQRKHTEALMVKVQNSLKNAKNKAEESDHLKSAFLANMSHEIRTPMNAIVGFCNLLLDNKIKPEQRDLYTQYINNSSRTLLCLIDDIIDIAKIEAGQLKISKSKIFLLPILRELHRIHHDIIKKRKNKDVLILTDFPKSDTVIITDEHRFRQVVTNLLSNAIKFTQKGNIVFGYRIVKQKEVQFFVQDSGIGIPKDKINDVFSRFVRVENHNLPDASGTGLGLSIAKRIVELLGGEIWLDSVEGQGSTFYFTLPYDVKVDNTINHVSDDFLTNNNDYSWNDKLILIAEDEFINFQFLKETLRPTGMQIIWAKNGVDAVQLALKNRYNLSLVLMDIKMPIQDGYEATLQIKRELPNLPIIAQTAYAMESEKENCMKAGFDDYLSKPINPKSLFKSIFALLNKHNLVT